MKQNIIKTRLQNNQPVLGILSNSADPTIAELCGFSGLDFYVIDAEHSPISAAQVPDIVRACEVSGLTPLVRVRGNEPALIAQFLDAGVMGILLPGVRTVADVEALVNAVNYPPVGSRALGAVRVADYLQGDMSQSDYLTFANEQLLILPQLETVEVMDNLDSLLTVAGIDGFVIMPRDLAIAMGHYDGPGHDEVRKAIGSAVDKIKKAGLVVGTTAATGDQARVLIERGVLFCLNSLAGLLKSSSSDFMRGRN